MAMMHHKSQHTSKACIVVIDAAVGGLRVSACNLQPLFAVLARHLCQVRLNALYLTQQVVLEEVVQLVFLCFQL